MLSPENCWVPSRRELTEECHGGNREYCYYGQLSWNDVVECGKIEQLLLESIDNDETSVKARYFLDAHDVEHSEMDDPTAEDAAYDIQMDFSDSEVLIYHLDLGCATAVAALAASGCPSVSSCNGGAFGGHHAGNQAYVAFHANPARLDLLNKAAETAGVELQIGSQGLPIVFAPTGCSGLVKFGLAMSELRSKIPKNDIKRERSPDYNRVRATNDDRQLTLLESVDYEMPKADS